MRFSSPRFFISILVLVALLALVVPIVAAQTEPATLPEAVPDGETGWEIYQNRCANCHGTTGMGDGELAPNSAVPPTAFAAPEYLRNAVPAAMFTTITNGIMGDFGPIMPAFGPTSSNPISEQNRWDAIAAIYSLGTPAENIAAGGALFNESCLECHGDDDPLVNDPAYWFNRSNQDVFTALSGEDIAEHTYDLTEDELWQVVDYARTLSYAYFDSQIAFAPIEAGTISGAVLNLTTDAPLTEPLTVTLNAFNMDFRPVLTQTTTLDDSGGFQFTVSDVEPDLIFVTTLDYGGVAYGSDFGQLERSDPVLSLPISVYETTTDDSGIVLDQIHVILQFVDGAVQVNELYQFGNNESLVYVGDNGIPGAGTVEIVLPAGAQDPQFTRTFGSLDNLVPANNLLETGTGWSEVTPIRPGRSTLNLLVTYLLPYDGELTLAHPVNYPVSGANLVMPNVGVTVGEEVGGWLSGGEQAMGGESFQTYTQAGLPAGSALQIALEGRPEAVAPAGSAAIQLGDATTEQILVGAGILLLVVGGGLYVVSLQRQRAFEADLAAEEEEEAEEAEVVPAGYEREQYLQAIVALDMRFEAGEIEAETYQQERSQLIRHLAAIWQAQQPPEFTPTSD